jgi:hypothetical protein
VILAIMCAHCTSRHTEKLGGQWEVETSTTFPSVEGGTSTWHKLYRRHGSSRVVVSEIVWVHRYYGDDCLAFDAHGQSAGGGGYFIACGDREPYRLSVEQSERWTLGDATLVAERYAGPNTLTKVEMSVAEAKRLALSQAPRGRGLQSTR